MNELAHAVHAMVADGHSAESVSRALSDTEKAALRELQPALSRSPADLERALVNTLDQPWL